VTSAADRGPARTTPDVRIRETTEEDLPALFVHQLDPEATAMAAFPPRDREAFLAHWRKVLADPACAKRTILADGVVAGHLGAFDMNGRREVGYWIGRELWGRGIATRALRLFLREETVRPLHAHVARHNLGSIRVLEKCGFTVVREQRGAIRGQEVDEVVLVLEAPP
jgi:RimJ/RimL family protein N-acetyltransferase